AKRRETEIERLLGEFKAELESLAGKYVQSAQTAIEAKGSFDINAGALNPFKRSTDELIRGLQKKHGLTSEEKKRFVELRQQHASELGKSIQQLFEKAKERRRDLIKRLLVEFETWLLSFEEAHRATAKTAMEAAEGVFDVHAGALIPFRQTLAAQIGLLEKEHKLNSGEKKEFEELSRKHEAELEGKLRQDLEAVQYRRLEAEEDARLATAAAQAAEATQKAQAAADLKIEQARELEREGVRQVLEAGFARLDDILTKQKIQLPNREAVAGHPQVRLYREQIDSEDRLSSKERDEWFLKLERLIDAITAEALQVRKSQGDRFADQLQRAQAFLKKDNYSAALRVFTLLADESRAEWSIRRAAILGAADCHDGMNDHDLALGILEAGLEIMPGDKILQEALASRRTEMRLTPFESSTSRVLETSSRTEMRAQNEWPARVKGYERQIYDLLVYLAPKKYKALVRAVILGFIGESRPGKGEIPEAKPEKPRRKIPDALPTVQKKNEPKKKKIWPEQSPPAAKPMPVTEKPKQPTPAEQAEAAQKAKRREIEIERILEEFKVELKSLAAPYIETAKTAIEAKGSFEINAGALIPFKRSTDKLISGLQKKQGLTPEEKKRFVELRQQHASELGKRILQLFEKAKERRRDLVKRLLVEFETWLQSLGEGNRAAAKTAIDAAEGAFDVSAGALIPFRQSSAAQIGLLEKEHKLNSGEKKEFEELSRKHAVEFEGKIKQDLEDAQLRKLQAEEDARLAEAAALARQRAAEAATRAAEETKRAQAAEALQIQQARELEMKAARQALDAGMARLDDILTKQAVQLRNREAVAGHRQVLLYREQIEREERLSSEERVEWSSRLDALIDAITAEAEQIRQSVDKRLPGKLKLAREFLKAKNYRQALDIFEALATDDQEDWAIRRQAFLGAAACHGELNRPDLARVVLEAALELRSGDKPIQEALARRRSEIRSQDAGGELPLKVNRDVPAESLQIGFDLISPKSPRQILELVVALAPEYVSERDAEERIQEFRQGLEPRLNPPEEAPIVFHHPGDAGAEGALELRFAVSPNFSFVRFSVQLPLDAEAETSWTRRILEAGVYSAGKFEGLRKPGEGVVWVNLDSQDSDLQRETYDFMTGELSSGPAERPPRLVRLLASQLLLYRHTLAQAIELLEQIPRVFPQLGRGLLLACESVVRELEGGGPGETRSVRVGLEPRATSFYGLQVPRLRRGVIEKLPMNLTDGGSLAIVLLLKFLLFSYRRGDFTLPDPSRIPAYPDVEAYWNGPAAGTDISEEEVVILAVVRPLVELLVPEEKRAPFEKIFGPIPGSEGRPEMRAIKSGAAAPGAVLRLEDVDLSLKDIFDRQLWGRRIGQIILVADNTGTLTPGYDKRLSDTIREHLIDFVSNPGDHLLIDSGDPIDNLQHFVYQPLLEELEERYGASGEPLGRFHFVADSGTKRRGFGPEAYDRPAKPWRIDRQFRYVRFLAAQFYDEFLKRPGHFFAALKGVSQKRLASIRDKHLRDLDRLGAKDFWLKQLETARKTNRAYHFHLLPADLEERLAGIYVYEVGAKVTLGTASGGRTAFPAWFTEPIYRKFSRRFGPSRESFYTVSGDGYIDLAADSKQSGAQKTLEEAVYPALDPEKITVVFVLGDNSNDIPMFDIKLPRGLRNAVVIPVFLNHAQEFAGDLAKRDAFLPAKRSDTDALDGT
ncbi:MAG: hypothetical protein WC352_08155, partial [Candidatus Omnitrophota bacterium]